MAQAIRSSAEMASLLRRSCPDEAVSFARRTYLRAAAGSDERATGFWRGVLDLLNAEEMRAGR